MHLLKNIMAALFPIKLLNLPSPGGRGRVIDIRFSLGPLMTLAASFVFAIQHNEQWPILPDWPRLLAILIGTLALFLLMIFLMLILVIVIPIWAMHLVLIIENGHMRSGFLNFGTLDTGDSDYLWRDDETLIIANSDENSWLLYRYALKEKSGHDRLPWNLVIGWRPRMRELTWQDDGPWIKGLMRDCGMTGSDFEREWENEPKPRNHLDQCRRFFSQYLPGAKTYGNQSKIIGFCKRTQLSEKERHKVIQSILESITNEGELHPESAGGIWREASLREMA